MADEVISADEWRKRDGRKAETFAVGEVVHLRSGGPLLTVPGAREGGRVALVYFNETNGQFEHPIFDAAVLTKGAR